MGLFDFFKKNDSSVAQTHQSATNIPVPAPATKPTGNEVFLDLNKGGLLNLQKNDFLNLSKTGVNLTNIRVSAGWDVNHHGQDYDLDLCAYMLDGENHLIQTVYYGAKRGTGLQLDQDNLTGEGKGDDENIFVNFEKFPLHAQRIVFAVVIYQAERRRQSFKYVDNAYVRMIDQSVRPERELCRYNLTEDGGENTAIQFAEIVRTSEGWTFHAIGKFSRDTISSLRDRL